MAEIDRLSGGEAIVARDVGQHQMWAAQFIRFNEPRLWINSGGLGSMGFGLPAAIGAQFARPDKLVFAIVGDGGFQMSIPELATIANHALPIKIIVMNNGYLGMVRQWQELFYNNRLQLGAAGRFPRCREAGGRVWIQGHARWRIRASCARRSKPRCASPARILLNVRVSPFENVYPMVPAGGAINEMVLGPPQPVAAGRKQERFKCCNYFTTGGKQARRADARHRAAQRARLQHRKPDGRADARSRRCRA